jgi:cytochrome P450
VLGLDLEQRTDEVSEPLRIALTYAIRRATDFARRGSWLPTPARQRARAASAQLHALTREILRECRADPTRVAPLVRALLAVEDPETGNRLSDEEICDELIIFLFAGHDTTGTTLTYALWSSGHHPAYQDRVAAEVAELPDRPLAPDDIPRLRYTVQVIRESMRLCPPAPTGTRMAGVGDRDPWSRDPWSRDPFP